MICQESVRLLFRLRTGSTGVGKDVAHFQRVVSNLREVGWCC